MYKGLLQGHAQRHVGKISRVFFRGMHRGVRRINMVLVRDMHSGMKWGLGGCQSGFAGVL